ncbi:ArsR/SmtB family transcription factor [Nocardia farcinica]|uniref:ArsR/SmtB family transcription factor n=1 Tax=Nocardia farcinica TaxID=37329 RepID=UPI002455CCEC|nr:metalloregulator ArsR/SmtB family transcription factor [Nocardia farcinica]
MSKQPLPITPIQACTAAPLVREPLTPAAAIELASVFRALSDPVRLQLLSSIASRAGQEACVCDISAGVEVSQPTISHHLKVLREAGLLESERRASWVYYRVVPAAMARIAEILDAHTTGAGEAVPA